MKKYEAYEANRKKRGWLVMENDGSRDGRTVACDLTGCDCKKIVRLLNKDNAEQKRRATDTDEFRPEVM